MDLLSTVRDNWFELLQTFGIIAGFLLARYSTVEEAKQRRITNRWEITSHYREIWSLRFSHPDLNRIDETIVDLTVKPVTSEEKLFVRMLILHLANCFRTAKAEMFTLPDEITADIQNFFSDRSRARCGNR